MQKAIHPWGTLYTHLYCIKTSTHKSTIITHMYVRHMVCDNLSWFFTPFSFLIHKVTTAKPSDSAYIHTTPEPNTSTQKHLVHEFTLTKSLTIITYIYQCKCYTNAYCVFYCGGGSFSYTSQGWLSSHSLSVYNTQPCPKCSVASSLGKPNAKSQKAHAEHRTIAI